MMKIERISWDQETVDHISSHSVSPQEVEEALFNDIDPPLIMRGKEGKYLGRRSQVQSSPLPDAHLPYCGQGWQAGFRVAFLFLTFTNSEPLAQTWFSSPFRRILGRSVQKNRLKRTLRRSRAGLNL